MIDGFATTEGTADFREKHEEKSVAGGHFRSADGLWLTSLGMGTYLGEPDDKSDQMIIDAIKLSTLSGAINVIDTAINYRSQKSERAIGRALKEMINEGSLSRDQTFVCTKNGYITDDGDLKMEIWNYLQTRLIKPGIIKPDDISSGYHCMTIPYLNDMLERSRRNLGLECIDLMYLHNAVEGQVQDVGMAKFMQMLKDVFQFYEEKRKEGKIRYYGMATWNCFRVMLGNMEYLSLADVVNLAREAGGENHGFRFIQLPFNMMMSEALMLKNQKAGDAVYSLIEAASMLKIGVFTSVPLMQSKLLGAAPKFGNIQSAAVRCLQFVRSSGVLAPLVGQKQLEHVQDNIQVAKIPPFGSEEFKTLIATLTKAANK